MIGVQVPELIYDLGPKTPVTVSGSEELSHERFSRTTFVSIDGKPNFEQAFVYRRYGLAYTYFNIDPYGLRLVVRTYEKVSDDWKQLNRFLGKLRPFNHQPFYYKIRNIYDEKFEVEIPDDAFFMGLDDVPKLSGWQLGAVIFAGVLWVTMFYFFFIYRWDTGGKTVSSPPDSAARSEAGKMADK